MGWELLLPLMSLWASLVLVLWWKRWLKKMGKMETGSLHPGEAQAGESMAKKEEGRKRREKKSLWPRNSSRKRKSEQDC